MTRGIYGDVNHEVLRALNSLIKAAYNEGFEEGKKAVTQKHDDGLDAFAAGLNHAAKAGLVTLIKSPNQQRAELIQRAREFVEEHKRTGTFDGIKKEHYILSYGKACCVVNFIVNKDKRAVVAIARGAVSNKILARGIAKCHPDEVFNADIGKAIALARALEIEIPQEFLQAVQPTEKVVGMVVGFQGHRVSIIPTGLDPQPMWRKKGTAEPDSAVVKQSTILDDTNAIYSEESK